MENKNKLKKEIIAYITEFFREFPEKEKVPNVWNTPIVEFADAMDPYIQNLPKLISPSHGLPQQVMEEAKTVLVYYAPFLKEVSASGRDATSYSAPYLEQAYQKTDVLFEKLNKELKEKLKKYGYRGVTDSEMNKYDEQKLISNWSFRHFAYAAGIGTFGLNNMLITRKGCCGRYNIMITNLDVEADRHREEEYCLYKKMEVKILNLIYKVSEKFFRGGNQNCS